MKDREEVEKLLADLDKREQKLLEEIERHRTTRESGAPGSRVEVAAAWWWVSKTALAKREITASPGRFSNTGGRLLSIMILEVPQLQVIDRLRDYSSCASDAMGLQ